MSQYEECCGNNDVCCKGEKTPKDECCQGNEHKEDCCGGSKSEHYSGGRGCGKHGGNRC
jgi:hypothetical protein